MTRLEIEAFLSVVRFGSISAAADQIFISQSALSRRIQALEKELGYPLFIRSKGFRNITLTSFGTTFVQTAEQFLQLYEEAENIPNRTDLEFLSLSAIDSIYTFVMPQVLEAYMKQYPDYHMAFHSHSSVEAYLNMEKNLLDYALVAFYQHSSSIVTTPVLRESYIIITRQPFAIDGPIAPDSLDPSQEIVLPWGPEFEVWRKKWFSHSTPKIVLNQMTLLSRLLQGDSYSIVPACVAHGLSDVYCYELTDPPEDRIVYGLTRNGQISNSLQAFLRIFYDSLKSLDYITLL